MLERRIVWIVVAGLGALAGSFACSGDDGDTDLGTSGTGGGTAGSGGGVIEDAGTLHGLAVVNPACGTGDGGVDDECIACATSSCSTQFEACFASSWETSLVGGVCESFGQCVTDCGCGDNECFQACLDTIESTPGDACYGCLENLFACEQTNCSESCTDELSDGGTSDGGQKETGTDHEGGKPD